MPVPAYRPLDRSLTRPIADPPPPAQRCAFKGTPAWCAFDGLVWIEQWRGKLREANADRATSAQITAEPQTAGNHPSQPTDLDP